MARLGSWIEPTPKGIYVRPADAWIDPSQPKAKALVTHGHADHARGGHSAVMATPETLAIMECRYGPQSGGQAVAYDETVRVGDVDVASCPPATCWARRRSSSSIRASGWWCPAITKTAGPDLPCFVPVPCDIFITEATFGLPVFRHPDTGSEIDRLLHRLHSDPDALRAGRRLCAGQGAAYHHRASPARLSRARLSARRAGTAVPPLRGARRRARRAAPGDRRAQGRAEGQDRHRPAERAQRPLVAAAARPGDGHGLGLDAHPPARGSATSSCR